MMTGKKLFVTILALVALVAWGAATPNLTVAQDQIRTRLLMQTPGSCLPACLPAPTKDQLHTQTRDKLQTPTTAVVAPTQPKPQAPAPAAVAATLPQPTPAPAALPTRLQLQTQTPVVSPTCDLLKLQTKDQIRLNTVTGGGRR